MNKNIDKFFEQAQKAENPTPLVTDEKLRSILDKKGGVGIHQNKIWQILKGNKIMTIIGSSIIALLLSFIIWMSTGTDNLLDSIENGDSDHANNSMQDGNNTSIKNNAYQNNESIIAGKESIPIIRLNDKELEKIGIYRKGESYEFYTEGLIDRQDDESLKELQKIGYSKSNSSKVFYSRNSIDTIEHKILKIGPGLVYRGISAKLMPIAIHSNNIKFVSKNIEFDGGAVLSSVFRDSPKLINDARQELEIEFDEIMDDVCRYGDYFLQTEQNLNVDKTKYPILSTLLPVYLHIGTAGRGSDILIWFLPNKAFLSSLPDRYKSDHFENKYENDQINFDFKEYWDNKSPKIEKYTIAMNNPKNSGWQKLEYNTRSNKVYGIPFKSNNHKVQIGSIELSIEDLKKVYDNLYDEIREYAPPSFSILSYEHDDDKFDSGIFSAVERAKKSKDGINAIGKIRLYSYIAKLIAYDIKGIPVLELNRDELSDIGIVYTGNGYKCYQESAYNFLDPEHLIDAGTRKTDFTFDTKKIRFVKNFLKKYLGKNNYDTTIVKGIYKNRLNLGVTEFGESLIEYNGWDMKKYSPFSPVAVTFYRSGYEFSKKWNQYNHTSTVSMQTYDKSPLLQGQSNAFGEYNWVENNFGVNRLIRVLVPTGNKAGRDSSKLNYTDYTLWFVASEEFVEALPPRYKYDISRELKLLERIESGSLKAEKACEAIKGDESYFDICRMGTETIKNVSLFPNPTTQSEINIKFELTRETIIKIDIHSISGRYFGNIDKIQFEKGEWKIIIEFKRKLPGPGVYLLSFTSDNGEQVVKRFIAQ